jgi:hypothetical protein
VQQDRQSFLEKFPPERKIFEEDFPLMHDAIARRETRPIAKPMAKAATASGDVRAVSVSGVGSTKLARRQARINLTSNVDEASERIVETSSNTFVGRLAKQMCDILSGMIDSAVDSVAQRLCDILLPRLEPFLVRARWVSVESAGAYIDKTYDGMKHTIKSHMKELPVSYLGGSPRIDIEDIDRLAIKMKKLQK